MCLISEFFIHGTKLVQNYKLTILEENHVKIYEVLIFE